MPVDTPSTPGPGSQPPRWSAGLVTGLGLPSSASTGTPPPGPPDLPTRHLWWFAGIAATVLVVGLALVIGLVVSGTPDPFRAEPPPAAEVRPPLARRCPPTTIAPTPGPADPARPDSVPTVPKPWTYDGKRTVDPEAGISYPAYGAPWLPWTTVWSAGTLEVPYKVGQHFVTEPAYDGINDYHASILSAAVPAAENDALALNLECVGRQVAADVRAEYYPRPSRMELLRDERSVLGGRPAWVTVFRLHFRQPGLRATDELAAVACIDVGRTTAAILYISIPGTHRELDWVVGHALASIRTV